MVIVHILSHKWPLPYHCAVYLQLAASWYEAAVKQLSIYIVSLITRHNSVFYTFTVIVSVVNNISQVFIGNDIFQFYNIPLQASCTELGNNNRQVVFYVYSCTFIYDDESNPVGVIAGDVWDRMA
jgi:hypothetical protein